jgi:hypothetical protein
MEEPVNPVVSEAPVNPVMLGEPVNPAMFGEPVTPVKSLSKDELLAALDEVDPERVKCAY